MFTAETLSDPRRIVAYADLLGFLELILQLSLTLKYQFLPAFSLRPYSSSTVKNEYRLRRTEIARRPEASDLIK